MPSGSDGLRGVHNLAHGRTPVDTRNLLRNHRKAGSPAAPPSVSSDAMPTREHGATIVPDGARFSVWAPSVRSLAVRAASGDHPLSPAGDGWFEGEVRGLADGDALRPRPRRGARPSRPRLAAPARRACTAPRRSSIRAGTPGRTRPGAGSRSRRSSSTSCTSAPSPARAPSTRRRRGSPDLVELGRHLRRAHAGPALPRRPELGLRRRRARGRCTRPTAAPPRSSGFVDRAHALGLGVCLDVVYNHLGPEGNYLPELGPYFTDRHRSLWGDGLDYDGAGRRAGPVAS